jgi:hypothetical protein
VVELVTVTV